MGVINAIERFQKQANEASSDKTNLVETTRQLALVADNIISATKLQEKRKEKQEEQSRLIIKPEEIEKIFVGDQKSPIISKEELTKKQGQNEQEIG